MLPELLGGTYSKRLPEKIAEPASSGPGRDSAPKDQVSNPARQLLV